MEELPAPRHCVHFDKHAGSKLSAFRSLNISSLFGERAVLPALPGPPAERHASSSVSRPLPVFERRSRGPGFRHRIPLRGTDVRVHIRERHELVCLEQRDGRL